MREFKCVVVGAGGVGKSALTVLFVKGIFLEKYDPTIEDNYRKLLEIDGEQIHLEILDTAGTEQYTATRDLYTKDGNGFALVYSITSRSSFLELPNIREHILRVKNWDKTGMVVVANKKDLDAQRVISEEEGQKLADEWGCGFLETSARMEVNVDSIFHLLVKQMMEIFPATSPKEKGRSKKLCAMM